MPNIPQNGRNFNRIEENIIGTEETANLIEIFSSSILVKLILRIQ